MRFMHRAAAVLVAAFVMGLMATTASAQVIAQSGDVIIKAAPGGGYSISHNGGRTWGPYAVRRVPAKPVKPVPVPPAPGQACDFYQCGKRLIVVPAGSPAPARGVFVGNGTIDGTRVDPRTNVLR